MKNYSTYKNKRIYFDKINELYLVDDQPFKTLPEAIEYIDRL